MLNIWSSMLRQVFAAALALIVGMSGSLFAQSQTPSLGELARKEQERRKGQKATGKVYTKKDLPPSPPTPPPSAAPAAAPDETKPPEKKPGDQGKDEKDEKDETWWKNRINQVREELRRNEMFAEALQTRINSLSTDFVNR